MPENYADKTKKKQLKTKCGPENSIVNIAYIGIQRRERENWQTQEDKSKKDKLK